MQHKKEAPKRTYKTVVSGNIRVFTPDYARDYGQLNLYAIYPDYWGENIGKFKGQHNWGEPPVLGYVRETSAHLARYAAYTAGIVPLNGTFKPKPVLVRRENKDKKKYVKGNNSN